MTANTTCLVSDELHDVVQREGGCAVPAGDQVGRPLAVLCLGGRAGPWAEAGRVGRLLGGTSTPTSPKT